jgi:glycosyltransferase involved in cell wall biosynthesis
LVDPLDIAEANKTRAVLEGPKPIVALRLTWAMFMTLLTRPRRFFRAFRLAMDLGGLAGRRAIHLIYLAEACVLRRWIVADHVHAHFGTNSAAAAALVHALGGPPFSFTVHGPEEFENPTALGLRQKARAAAFIVAISEFGRAELAKCVNEPQNIRVVRCGLDASYFTEATPVPATNKLVCVGRLAPQKGQLVVIEAAAKLRAKEIPLELILIGDGPLRGEVESAVARHGLQGIVRLAGWLNNAQIRDELKSSRALVLSSYAEGLPVVIMEALAMGRPVVATCVAGVPELVNPGENGWLVPPGDATALAAAMEEVLRADPAKLTEMGRAGAKRVRENHDAATEAAKLLAAIQDK